MKVAHLADPHLGFRQYHRQTPGGFNQREADVGQAFRHVIDQVIGAAPRVVVLAGDLFHSVRPSNPAILFAFHEFRRLRQALPETPVILVAGNHDTPRSSETGTILTLFESVGVEVVSHEARRLEYPHLDLSVLAVPHEALVSPARPLLRREGDARYQVLVTHGEVDGLLPIERTGMEYGGALLSPSELGSAGFSYVALGHYHVMKEVLPRVWYSGSTEYVSTNPWGESREEAEHGIPGKGWLLADLDDGSASFQPLPLARRVIDLEPINAAEHTAESVDALIRMRIDAAGPIAGQIVRQVLYDIPRHVARELDHAAIRAWKAEALHFHLDLRRPEARRESGIGAPGRRQTLAEIVESYLTQRPLDAGMDREKFVKLGVGFLAEVDGEAVTGG